MIPSSVSATSLNTAMNCLARYKHENIDYAPKMDNNAALLGTVCHAALELYVKQLYIEKSIKASVNTLIEYYDLFYLKHFKNRDTEDDKYKAGLDMLERWHRNPQNDLSDREVISVEQKKFLMLETSAGPIKLTYIIDRFEKTGENEYRIVDYKSSAFNIRSGALRKKLQPKIYSLAMFCEYPDAEKMWVCFDMLRFQQSEIEFTKQDARDAYNEIMEIIETIIATPEDAAPEKLNPECNWCVRKATCKTLLRNIAAGGIFELDLDSQIDLRVQIEMQKTALAALAKELDTVIEEALGHEERIELTTNVSRAFFKTSRNNVIKSKEQAERIAGSAIFDRYAKKDITLEQYKKLVKDPALTQDQINQLKALMVVEYGDPRLNFSPLGDDESVGMVPVDPKPAVPAIAKKATKLAPIIGLED